MERQLKITADGSHTLFVPALNETYHSMYGALQESLHVFIDAGFRYATARSGQSPLRILEIGFGTGLNALLTWEEAVQKQTPVYYEAIEKYPLSEKEAAALNYAAHEKLYDMHRGAWEIPVALSPYFTLCKRITDLLHYHPEGLFDVIYFDAFAPTVQPELWSEAVFYKLYTALRSGGVLVTYSSKGIVKTALRTTGFELQRLSGAIGKRHMLRAIKI